MRLETFRGRDVSAVNAIARRALGDDALILETRASREGVRAGIEVDAVPAADLDRVVRLVLQSRPKPNWEGRPRVVALVGPTGAGKTTTVAKLATHPKVFGHGRIGLLTLDTHRAAGFDQLNAYADAAGLPCAIAYDAAEAQQAMRRFRGCDVVLVDTAGRGPGAHDQIRRAQALLSSLRPDEVHLVVPATTRVELARGLRAAHAGVRPTHAILTKLDEAPSDRVLAALTSALGLPMRWVTDGQDVPTHVKPAAGPVLRPLGLTHRSMVAA